MPIEKKSVSRAKDSAVITAAGTSAGDFLAGHNLLGLSHVDNLCLGAGGSEPAAEDREFDAQLMSRLEEEDARSTLYLALAAGALVILLAALAVRLTFHVAGPARAVSTMLKHMAEGDPDPVRHLRRGERLRSEPRQAGAGPRRVGEHDSLPSARLVDSLRKLPDGKALRAHRTS